MLKLASAIGRSRGVVSVFSRNRRPINFTGDLPTRWLNVGLAISIQEMRPHQ